MTHEPIAVPAYTAEQVRAAEEPLLTAGAPLMARAAGALSEVAAETLDARKNGARTLVLAGAGNNGGDALFAAARLLAASAELSVDVLTLADRWHAAGLEAAIAAGARRVTAEEAAENRYDLVVDGILGIGTAKDPSLRGLARQAVEAALPAVREGRTSVIAVDIPSGLHPDTGAADEAVLPAAVTVTFGGVKRGLSAGRGPELAGRIVLVRIGIEDLLATAHPAGEARVSRIIDKR